MAVREVAVDEALVAEAYERVKHEMAALKVEELEVPKLDVHLAVRTILGSLPEIRALRAGIAALPQFDVAAFDKLEDYALALSHAHAAYQMATEPPDELEQVFAEGSRSRERLVATARALALSELFDERKLEQLRHGNGYSNVAQDLQALSAAFEEGWAKLEGKMALSLEDVRAASRLGLRLTRLVGLREQGSAALAAATEQRQRAFTLVSRTYNETRAAVRYVRRREDDAESFAPTLYVGVGKAKRRATEENEEDETAAASAPSASAPAAPTPAQSEPFMA